MAGDKFNGGNVHEPLFRVMGQDQRGFFEKIHTGLPVNDLGF